MTPTPDLLRELFEYMRWADLLMVEAARTVPDEPYYADMGISFGSIHKLLVHGMAAQKVWLARFRGVPTPKLEDAADHPTRADLDRRWPEVHDDLFAFLDAQTAESLGGTVVGKNFKGIPFALPLGKLMLHVVDHATYHRGQVNSMIKKAGGTPADPYYALYLRAHENPA